MDSQQFNSWLADIDGCFACGQDHRGIDITIDHNYGDWFICPAMNQQVRVKDPGNRTVSIAAVTREVPDGQPDGLSKEGRARTRRMHYRTDADITGHTADQVVNDDVEETALHAALQSFSKDQRRILFEILIVEFGAMPPIREADSDLDPELIPHLLNARRMLDDKRIPEAEAAPVNAYQIGGEHYGLKAFQHWDMVAMFSLDYFQGQITKYVMRWRDKNGIEDLEKAAHYLEKYIDIEKDKKYAPRHTDLMVSPEAIDAYLKNDSVDPQEREP